MTNEWEEEIGSFVAITDAPENTAKFYIDSAQGAYMGLLLVLPLVL